MQRTGLAQEIESHDAKTESEKKLYYTRLTKESRFTRLQPPYAIFGVVHARVGQILLVCDVS